MTLDVCMYNIDDKLTSVIQFDWIFPRTMISIRLEIDILYHRVSCCGPLSGSLLRVSSLYTPSRVILAAACITRLALHSATYQITNSHGLAVVASSCELDGGNRSLLAQRFFQVQG
jgi:hypothetical protein